MVDFIFDIYKYAQLVPALKEIIELCYRNDATKVKESWKEIQDLLPEFCKTISTENLSLANQIMDTAASACSYTTGDFSNYNLMGDALNSVIALVQDGMACISSIDATEDSLRLVSSQSGFLALENTNTHHFYNSLLDPMWEAKTRVAHLYLPRFTEFHIVGCELGYLAYELFCLSDQSMDIYIHHTRSDIVDYAFNYGVLSWIPEDKLHIEVYDSISKLESEIEKINFNNTNIGFVMTLDVIDLLDADTATRIASHTIEVSTRIDFHSINEINLWRNLKNIPRTIHDAPKSFYSKDWIVIVAGPSLDDNLDFIKENAATHHTICASTVYKKLLSNGITPDFVVVCDPQTRTFGHFEGITSHDSVLLLEATGNWRFSEYYGGDKYIVPSFSNETAINYFESHNTKPIFITGSVAYACVELALFFDAKTVHLIGLDLAYPNGQSHASGTMDNHALKTDGMIEIPSVSGGTVLTTPQFMYYITTMNKQFKSHPEVRFINHSAIGARFEGTIRYK